MQTKNHHKKETTHTNKGAGGNSKIEITERKKKTRHITTRKWAGGGLRMDITKNQGGYNP
ncbi:MAG: hypothetical protein U9Q92_03140 [archaeon]|nr:hypothetical protein [archaeon]